MNTLINGAVELPFVNTLLKSQNIAVMLMDSSMEMVDYSPGLKTLFRLENDDLQLRNLLKVCQHKIIKKAGSGETECASSRKITLEDGSVIFVKIKIIGLIKDNSFNGAVVFLEDETEHIDKHVLLEMKLNEQFDLMRKLYLESPVGIFIINSENARILHANPTICSMLGYTESEIRSRTAYDITHPEDQGTHIGFYQESLNNQMNIFQFRKRYLKKDGSPFWAHISVSIIKDKYGSPLYDVATIQEITEVVEAQKKVEAQDQQLSTKNRELEKYIDSNAQLQNFAYIASHDMKAPLRMIGSFTQLLNHRLSKHFGEREQEYMDYILNGVRDMSQLIDSLLDYAKIKKEDHKMEAFNLHLATEAVLRNLSKVAEDKGAEIQIEELPVEILGNKTQIIQLFQNLIANGLKFQEEGNTPKVKVLSEDHNTHWLFKVIDNGIGIPKEHHEQIFELFNRLNAKTTYEGSGIGLAYCKRVVDLHSGKIWVESELGNGTTFFFTIKK